MNEIARKEDVYAIIGAAIEVHTVLGGGFLEAVYQEALEFELGKRGIPFQSQVNIRIKYKETYLGKAYIADLVCIDDIIVEIKSQPNLTSRDEAQVLNYLNATGFQVGLLINFGSCGRLEWKRFVR
ncbi:MAG: GxxExxY protein [Pseudomonadota bacterium]|nr:GxxExxY protein [Pseudomonadota bacterium]